MTGLAFEAGHQVGTMVPIHLSWDAVYADPRNRRLGLRKLNQLLDSRFFLGDAGMAGHAASSCRERHVIAGIRVRMAFRAFEAGGRVRLVIERKRLYRGFRLRRLLTKGPLTKRPQRRE